MRYNTENILSNGTFAIILLFDNKITAHKHYKYHTAVSADSVKI